MKVHFEELSALKRAGGIEAATHELAAHLPALNVQVTRSALGETCAQPDCVHVHGIWSPALARKFMAWHRRGVPCVVTPHGMLETWSFAHKRMKKLIGWHLYQKRLLQRAAVLHGTSERETGQFKKLGLRPPTAMITWGVEMPLQNRKSEIGNRKSEIRTALFVGRIFPVKGLPLLVQAWARVRPKGWRLKIVGPDEAGHRAEVAALVRELALEPAVEFTGELTGAAKAAAFQGADLYLQPSYTENFGMAIVEALAHALPVVTTTGTPWCQLPERGCGWWVAPSVDELARALSESTAMEDAQRLQMGLNGREWVEKEFAWPQTAQRMKETYLLAQGKIALPDFVCI